MRRTNFRFVWFIVAILALIAIFIQVRGNSKTVLKKTIYQQWTQGFVVSGGDYAYIKTTDDETKDVVLSESQGYGMVIAVDAAKAGEASQEDFDKLYNYYLAQRDGDSQLMSWRQTIKDGNIEAEANNATDGDLYIAYSLIKAAEQWPEHGDTYLEQAKAILADILAYNYNEQEQILTVGNWANAETSFHNLVRTSDVLPEQFDAFFDLTDDQRWLDIKDSMLTKLEVISDKYKTGLLPDFIWVNGSEVTEASANDIESQYDGYYSYNACRLPYNLARSSDAKSKKLLTKMMAFFMDQERTFAGYSLDGKALTDHQASSFVAPIVYAANSDSDYRRLVQANKYIFMTDLSSENYYEAALVALVALEIL